MLGHHKAAGVDPGRLTFVADLLPVEIIPDHGDQLDRAAHPGGIFTDVVGHSADRGADAAGIRVLHDQFFPAPSHQVDVRRPNPDHIPLLLLGEDIALAENVPLFREICQMYPHRRTGNAQSLCDLRLRQHWIFAQQIHDLSFPLGHVASPFLSFCLFVKHLYILILFPGCVHSQNLRF